MSKHKRTGAVCIAVVAVTLLVTILFMAGSSLGVVTLHNEPLYVQKLFSTDRVHMLDIVADESDWDAMIANATAEEYILCNVVIDGEAVNSVGIRPKGNSSLSTIAMSDSDRYSFKIEFDHYQDGKNYYGLDKLAVNNIAQDNTYMKDYVSYQMMTDFGAEAPLTSFIFISVNGEDWGLYLAAEGIEEAFAERTYGSDYGQIYKPDSMDMNAGGGFGGGNGGENRELPEGFTIPEGFTMPENGEMPDMSQFFENGEMPEGGFAGRGQGGGMGGFGGMGGGVTSLVYTDDDPDNYSAIFDNAVFDTKASDETRLLSCLKQLNEKENLEQVVDIDEVMRYFVVHNFVLNSDSYTGSMIHNYYLHENDGKLSMIAWDYNLAFGGMGGMVGMGFGGNGTGTASSVDSTTALVNSPIDTPVSGGSESRPMIDWILSDENYLEQYHALFSAFISEYFDSGKFAEMYDSAIALIAPYVEKDPTAFCTYDEFLKGQEALREFCLLRAESVRGQLDGTIAATSEAQTLSTSGFVDASQVDFSSMGSNSNGFGRARNMAGREANAAAETNSAAGESSAVPPEGFTMPEGRELPEGFEIPEGGFPAGGERQPPNGGAVVPETTEPSPTETNEPPANAEQAPANQGNFQMPNWGGGASQTVDTQTTDTARYILLGAAVLILLGGLVFAKRFKA